MKPLTPKPPVSPVVIVPASAPAPAGGPPKHTHRNILQLGWCGAETKGLEAVTETQGDTTNAYYQVVKGGKEELQTISLKEAQERYDSL